MNNLTINGIDYNAELELLKEYMREMINISEHCIKIDVRNLKKSEVDTFINTFRRTGLVMRNSAILDGYISPPETSSFAEWKQYRACESFWNRLDCEYFFPKTGFANDNPMDSKWIDKKQTLN